MSFADPQSVTIGGSAVSLPRVSTGANKSEYLSADGLVKLSNSIAYGKRIRRVTRLDHSKITPDPFIPAQNVEVSSSIYIVVDSPKAGYTSADLLDLMKALMGNVSASTYANAVKLLAGES